MGENDLLIMNVHISYAYFKLIFLAGVESFLGHMCSLSYELRKKLK